MMPNPKRKKSDRVTTSIKAERKSNGPKSAMDTLLATMKNVIDDGAREMTPKELAESERKFNAALDRAVVSRKRRRETA